MLGPIEPPNEAIAPSKVLKEDPDRLTAPKTFNSEPMPTKVTALEVPSTIPSWVESGKPALTSVFNKIPSAFTIAPSVSSDFKTPTFPLAVAPTENQESSITVFCLVSFTEIPFGDVDPLSSLLKKLVDVLINNWCGLTLFNPYKA